MTQPENNPGETGVEQHVCKFPVGYDPENPDDPFVPAGHAMEAPARRGRGRPSEYCGEERVDPDGVRRRHDRATAFQRRRELELEAAGQAPRRTGPPPRPVTSSRASLRELLAEIEMTTTSHREQMGQLLDRVTDVVATAGDPDAAVAEVARIRAEAQAESDAAAARAADAEQDAIIARRERDRALEDKTLAEGAAEDALAARDEAIADRDEQVAAARADAEQARQDAAEARADRDTALAAAEQRIADTETAAQERIRTVTAEAEDRIEQARSDAQARVDRAVEQLQQATVDRNAAISERAGAEQAAADARAETERMRRELVDTQAAHREELAQARRDIAAVRAEAREDREQQRSDHAAEVARIHESTAAQVNALRQALSTAESANSRLESEIARTKGAPQ
ncbi:hypothetical protein [Nocardia jinanensis]|uniref:Uncharacterized protein n=1 Tax=Nocardia jinanensis TaxID=382504 RepID=A0A917VY46_9NOCA|nr:hypothetical protein [Nocardia jinanensis]GGL44151.1 hypothetical protein GCM10011588_68570 [Nocardia jinanensis]